MTKFQVWVNDSELIGHLIGYTEEEAEEYKLEYAQKIWNTNLNESDVSLCEIEHDYYDKLHAYSDF